MSEENQIDDELELDVEDEEESSDEGEEELAGDEDEGDESEDESTDDGEEDEEEEQPRKKGRANPRIQALSADKKAEKERADRAEQEAAQLRQQMQTLLGQTNQQTQAAEEAKLAKMTPTERIAYEVTRQSQNTQNQLLAMQFQIADTADRSAYEARSIQSPVHKKYQPKVEQMLGEYRKKGQTVPRETLLAYLVGQELLKKQSSPDSAKRKKAAASRVNRATTTSSSARGDIGRTRKGKTAEQRLEGVLI